MLDTQNQGPQCTACGSPMKLTAIEPAELGQDRRFFTCPHCRRVQRHIIDSTVTEAWVEPQRVIKQCAVTYEIHNGRMIPKPVRAI
jgi:hypothetical protein